MFDMWPPLAPLWVLDLLALPQHMSPGSRRSQTSRANILLVPMARLLTQTGTATAAMVDNLVVNPGLQ
eukprot:6492512-Amphidinium_carterae.2